MCSHSMSAKRRTGRARSRRVRAVRENLRDKHCVDLAGLHFIDRRENSMLTDPELHNINSVALSELHQAWLSERLTIIVGAGASIASGLPSWDQLLDELIVQYVAERFSKPPYIFFADDIRAHLKQELKWQSPIIVPHYLKMDLGDKDFINLVHKALYRSVSSNPVPGPIYQAIGRMGAKLNSVITFNYDDLAEQALSNEGYPNTPVWLASHWSAVSGLPVYHPHGFLPYLLQSGQPYWITLAEADYHTQYGSPYNWSNVAIARSLLESTCLIVGSSISDPNLRRLLDYIHRENPAGTHYFMWRTSRPSALIGTPGLVHSVYEELFTKSYAGIGLKPVWYFEYDEIPTIIDGIRTI